MEYYTDIIDIITYVQILFSYYMFPRSKKRLFIDLSIYGADKTTVELLIDFNTLYSFHRRKKQPCNLKY